MNKRKRNKAIVYLYSVVMLLLVVTVSLGVTVMALETRDDGTICEGVSVSGINMAGKTVKEAKSLVADQLKKIREKRILVDVTDNGKVVGTEEVTLETLGISATGEEVIDEVIQIGKTGNIIERYKELKDAKEKPVDHALAFDYTEKKVEKFVSDIVKKYTVKAEDASLKRENGQFIISGGKTGKKLDKAELTAAVKTLVNGLIAGLPDSVAEETKVASALETTKPKYDKEDLAKVKDLLGSYTTVYGLGRGGREQNIANGARLINGSLVLPGETLSANKKMYPYTLANGYGIGGAYLNGKVVQDIGGGICQVSTTLYNAILYSELDIVQRQGHSMKK